MLPLFLVIQLHLLGSSSSLGQGGGAASAAAGCLSIGAIKLSATKIFWSNGGEGGEQSVMEESVELCDKESDKEDKDNIGEQLLFCSPMG